MNRTMMAIALMMEAARTSETLVNFYQAIRRYNPEDTHLLGAILVSNIARHEVPEQAVIPYRQAGRQAVIPCYEVNLRSSNILTDPGCPAAAAIDPDARW
jgi:hypothetical protein